MEKRQERVLSIVLLLLIPLGLLLIALPHIYAVPDYADMEVKEFSVASMGYTSTFRGGKSYYLITKEGEQMYLQGDFSIETIQANLRQRDTVMARCHRGRYLFWEAEYVCEMKLGDLVLVEYWGDDYQQGAETACLVMGIIAMVMGAGLFGAKRYYQKKIVKE